MEHNGALLVGMAGTSPAMTPSKNLGIHLLLEPVDEPAQHLHPDLVLADLIFDAVLEVGVVVDFHHDETRVGLLDVDSIETIADRARGADRNVDQLARRVFELEGLEAALARRAVGTVLDDLPMPARHP